MINGAIDIYVLWHLYFNLSLMAHHCYLRLFSLVIDGTIDI